MKKTLLNHVAYMTRLFILAFITQCLTMSFLLAWNGNAQVKSIEEVKVYLSLDEVKIEKAFKELEKHTNYNFVFATRELRDLPLVTFESDGKSVYEILAEIAVQARLNFKQVDLNIHVKKSNIDQTVTIVETVDVTVSGTVTDQNGNPLPGVTVSVSGTSIGTATDLEGKYTLSVPEGSTLVFSFIGFESQRIEVGSRTVIDVTLNEDMTSLDEVVVVGYGTERRSDLTGAITSVDGEELQKLAVPRIDQALQGQAAGVQISNVQNQPGGGVNIRIRGQNSITGDNNPLIVIDGILGGDIRMINPNDVASVDVLKDASATAIYGSRGSNGVIIITTKRGQTGAATVDVSSYMAMQEVRRFLPVLNAQQ